MAGLPRGLLNLSITTIRPLLRPRTCKSDILAKLPKQRLLSTSPIRFAKSAKGSRDIPTQAQAANKAGTNYALVKTLASKGTPTILYEAPSHFWFYFGCWSSGLSILAWVGLTGPWTIFRPIGAEVQWTLWVLGTTYILLAAMGFWLISKTPGIVSQIRAIPSQATRPVPTPAATAAPVATSPTLKMEVTVQRMLPFLQPKVLTVDLDKVNIKSRFSLPEEHVPQLRRQQLKDAELERAKEQKKFDMQHLMTLPFRKIGRGIKGMFEGVKSAWTDSGFGTIRVDGSEYKVNVTKGFAHGGFQTLERLVPVKKKV